MAKVTLDQKRLEILRRQLYGGSENLSKTQINQKVPQPENQISWTSLTPISSSPLKSAETLKRAGSEISYLRSDLFKILILSSLAIAIQAGLYFASINKIVRLTF